MDSIKKRFSKGEDISSDESSRLLLSKMRETKDIMRKSSFQNMLSSADEKRLRKTAQSLNDSKDIERLGWLKELADLKGEGVLSSSLAGQIEGIRDSSLTEEQRSFKATSERISKQMKLFYYALQRGKTGEFMDARQDEV